MGEFLTALGTLSSNTVYMYSTFNYPHPHPAQRHDAANPPH